MNFYNHWLSNTMTNRMAPTISEILKGNSRRILRESSISDWQANGELNVSYLGSAKHLCDVVFSSKKMTLILRYTESILCNRKSWVLGVFSRMILHVKSVSSSTIYGITLCLKHRKEPHVGWSSTQSLLFFSGYFSKFQGWNPQWDSRITPLDCRRGTLSWLLSIYRLPAQVQM